MPRGVPRIGQARTSSAGDLTDAPAPVRLGSIDINPSPAKRTYTFDEDGPPPWEVDPKWGRDSTDARRFVDVPDSWELRWLNPRAIDRTGFRDWQAVSASDERVTLKVPQMCAADNTIRRGGHEGDLLAFMPRAWVESRKRLKAERVARLTQRSVDRQAAFHEEAAAGHFGPHVRPTPGRHPTHTIADGRSMQD